MRKQHGFSLIETLIALGLLSGVVVYLLVASANSQRTMAALSDRQQAQTLAVSHLELQDEHLALQGLLQQGRSGKYVWQLTAKPLDYRMARWQLYELTIQVDWQSLGKSKQLLLRRTQWART